MGDGCRWTSRENLPQGKKCWGFGNSTRKTRNLPCHRRVFLGQFRKTTAHFFGETNGRWDDTLICTKVSGMQFFWLISLDKCDWFRNFTLFFTTDYMSESWHPYGLEDAFLSYWELMSFSHACGTWVPPRRPNSLQLVVVAESWECEITTKHFRYLNGGILTYISCMDTACIREHPPPQNSLIRFSTSVLGTWHVWWDYHQTILMNESIDDRKDNPYQPNHPMSTWLSWSIHCQSWIMSTPWLFDDSEVL